MTKQEALDKIAELRKFVEQEDAKPDYSQWVGKWGFYSDCNPECPEDERDCLRKLIAYNAGQSCPFECGPCSWRYFRPAKPEEIFPELFGDYVDWSKVPIGFNWIAVDGDGEIGGYDVNPILGDTMWIVGRGGSYWRRSYNVLPDDVRIGPLPPWRDSLRHRPNTGT